MHKHACKQTQARACIGHMTLKLRKSSDRVTVTVMAITTEHRLRGHSMLKKNNEHEDNLCNGSSGSQRVIERARARRSISSPLSVLSSAGSSCGGQRPSGAQRSTSKAYSDSFLKHSSNITGPPQCD